MADNVRFAYGAKVKYDTDGAGTGLVEVAKVVSFKPPKRMRKEVDATHLQSTDGHMQVAPATGMKDTEKASFTALYTDASFYAIDQLFLNGTEVYWYFQAPLSTAQTTPAQDKFRGMVTSLENQELNVDGTKVMAYVAEVTRTEAKVTFTVGA